MRRDIDDPGYCDSNIGLPETKQEREERLREDQYFRDMKRMEGENIFLKEVLSSCRIVLIPMAKGYAHDHQVGENVRMVIEMENTIKVALGEKFE